MIEQEKLRSWSEPFREALHGTAGARLFEISLVESTVIATSCHVHSSKLGL